MNPYEVLGVAPAATAGEIKAAYRKLSRRYHPDKGGDHAEMARVNDAYAVISDPARRKRFDDTGQLREPQSTDSQVRDALFQAMAAALEKATEQTDLVKAAKGALQNGRQSMCTEMSKAKAQLQRLAKQREKLQDGGLFAGLFDQRIEALQRGQGELAGHLDVIDEALKRLDGCRWTGDPEPMFVQLFTSGATTTSTYSR